ncbi:TetR/AcrR family transcriptional regulator [Mycobacterium sp. MYCO198283]|uniref:TetR/AcrR family transcriptional regulator n=1 Tax=Mycobacterium sp. MYCO198283 TaxID=2883505 RepID=UPI001E45B333|nr:TetR/AcrR family transcriptional regulator [Mycobacterium sp. MYCO198283]MCG5433342.1 TetR/AcrR family transcriptional regulator [Mycobacterium sp. MYCO198283]
MEPVQSRATRREPVSRRARPAKAPLSRAAIVDAALTVIERDGKDDLSMRKVAGELNTGAASLYVYVRNTTHLRALVLDRLLAQLDLSWDGVDCPRSRLHRLLIEYMDLLIDHPAVAQAALYIWPDGPHYLDLLELLLKLLLSAGISPDERAAWAVDLLLQHCTASALEWSQRSNKGEQGITDLIQTLQRADPDRHPTLHTMGSDIFIGGSNNERRDRSVAMLLSAILAPPSGGTDPSRPKDEAAPTLTSRGSADD